MAQARDLYVSDPPDSTTDTVSITQDSTLAGDEPFFYLRAAHIYEGTDSEDDEKTTRGRASTSIMATEIAAPSEFEAAQDQFHQQGQLCGGGDTFCLWNTVKTYPYLTMGGKNRDKVNSRFYDGGKLYERVWDFYYLYRSAKVDASQAPFLLVPTVQVQHFLHSINQELKTNLAIPEEDVSAFKIPFPDDGTPRPRYLGRSVNKDGADRLRNNPPPSYYKLSEEDSTNQGTSQLSLAAFKDKIDMMLQAQKGKKAANKEKQKRARIEQQQSWKNSLKRVQRCLGIRLASHSQQVEDIRVALLGADLGFDEHEVAFRAAIAKLRPSVNFDPKKLAPYDHEGSAVFISIDVEANENNSNQITEVGIATLDTEDLKTVVPGRGGENWFDAIRARHIRVNEYKNITNSEFVHGCPDKFGFGTSEFINLKDLPSVIASAFKHPFSKPTEGTASSEALSIEQDESITDMSLAHNEVPVDNLPKRNIILVGHDVTADINYFRKAGYDMSQLVNLQDVADTASMWRYLKREPNPRSLGNILAELDIPGWNLHNAGNDAMYTLQAMIKIAIKHLEEAQRDKREKLQEKSNRVAESIKQATLAAWEREEGWSSSGENSDGGTPVVPQLRTAVEVKGFSPGAAMEKSVKPEELGTYDVSPALLSTSPTVTQALNEEIAQRDANLKALEAKRAAAPSEPA